MDRQCFGTIVVLVAIGASVTGCNRNQKTASVASANVTTTTAPQKTQASGSPQAAPVPTSTPSTPAASGPLSSASTSQAKLVVSDHTQTLTVAQQSFRLLTHVQKIEGTSDETVEWWELRNAKDRVIYHGSGPSVEIQNGSLANMLSITANDFNTAQGGGVLIHGFELPSAPDAGGWVQVFGFKYGRDKYGLDESLFGPFGPPILIEGEFLDLGTDPLRPTPVSFGGANVTVMHDVLRFRLRTGNFNIVYPVLINWITGRLEPAARCVETTSKGRVERCSYAVTAESHREDQPTFVRLFPEPDEGFTPKHVIVQPQSKVEFIEARVPVAWNEDNNSISFGISGDNWLKIRVDGVEGWIHGEEDFEAIGLPQSG